jgi:glycosyltransferase involved in cell wall biosynthesis
MSPGENTGSQVTEQSEALSQAPEVPLNIALLVDNDYLHRFRSIFSHMLVGLVDQPINVTLVCPDAKVASAMAIGPAKVVQFKVPFWPWQYRRSLEGLAAELRSAKVNLVHACSGRSCWLAVDVAKRLDIPYAITFNGLFQEECYLRVDHAHCGRLIAISQPIFDTLHELYGKASDKIELIRPGCFLRPRVNKAERPKTLVSVGELDRHGGYDTLLRALAQIQARGLEFLMIIFGHGPLEHELHSWVNRNKLSNSVSFLDLLTNWEDVLSDADFYIQPGPFYALHSGPYEALAHGCPLLATRDTALDLVQEDRTGKLFNTGDAESLAAILADWIQEKLDWQAMSDQSLAFARTELSLANSIDRLIECYRSILAGADAR